MGKGKKIVLRSMREEDVSANEGMINHNKKETQQDLWIIM